MASGLTDPRALEQALRTFIAAEPLAEAEVVAVRDPATLAPLDVIKGTALVLLYIKVGRTRLLDNRVIGSPASVRAPQDIAASTPSSPSSRSAA